ncbi:hypothetical protein ONS95_005529 [Cadophora gregata]|uniref:uncharacterized protein n=1 Tax=Cadophora gregata TaxID=51156 RepID=UPI0026DB6957|nr:uncharacterized protein ONS95_005529 [Cadophora gregata]KAK0103508.1 hypothetical protein ONS95_005529 [Cadophora gregata]KAK0107701.1 hypothetical protein ONS96_003501 [Cadophora gregata f. sp. sojae]
MSNRTKDSSQPLGPAPTRLRQIALVARDLEKARHLLTTTIGTEVIYEDPAVEQWGLKNILVPIGGDIIEVVSPTLPTAPATRHLEKLNADAGGYMIIMQTHMPSALTRLEHITIRNLARPIFTHSSSDSDLVQYHPKGIPGGMMPELDSHRPDRAHPDPLYERCSPWHAAGPKERYGLYREGMKRCGDLRLVNVVLRLRAGDGDVEGAAKKWEEIFGVARGKRSDELGFTNAKLRFCKGEKGRNEGLVEVGIAVEGMERRDGILKRAEWEGLKIQGGVLEMLGIRWRFTIYDGRQEVEEKSNL